LKIYVAHDSVATQLKRGVIFKNHFIANCPQYAPVKEFWKSVNMWRKYGKWQSGTFLGGQRIYYHYHTTTHGTNTIQSQKEQVKNM